MIHFATVLLCVASSAENLSYRVVAQRKTTPVDSWSRKWDQGWKFSPLGLLTTLFMIMSRQF